MNRFLLVVAVIALPALAEEAPDGGIPVELSAKLGEGVTVRSGEFSVNLRGRFQLQAAALVPTEDSTAIRSNTFNIRRARLILKGEMPHHLSWTLHLGFSPQDLEVDAPNPIRDLYVQWNGFRDVSIRAGQMKVPFDVQRWVSSASLLMVDRSVVTVELNVDRDIGLLLFSDDLFGLGKRLSYAIGVWQGDGRNRLGSNVGLLYTARVRVSPLGAIDDKVEDDVNRSASPRFSLGASVGRNIGTPRPRSTQGIPFTKSVFDYTHAEGDVFFKWMGVSVLGEVYLRDADTDSHTVGTLTEFSRSAWGWFAQAGAFATDWLELTARYGDLRPMKGTDPTLTRIREIGGGVNVLFIKHDLKLQADYFWLDDGLLGNGRHQVRVQAQLYF